MAGQRPYQPGNAVMHLLSSIAHDHSVPIDELVELVHEMHEEFLYRLAKGEFASELGAADAIRPRGSPSDDN